MKTKKEGKFKKGISLIVLVITIIVMIILAAAIIISLSNNGIIGKANEAVEQTNLKNVQEVAQLIWADIYLENLKGANLDYEKEIKDRLKDQDIDTSGYDIDADGNGVTVTIKGKGSGEEAEQVWIQDGTVVTNTETNKTYNVGDYVDYVATGSNYTGEGATWQILGAEEGKLLIVSSGIVASPELGSSTDIAVAQSAWETLVADMDAACESYGDGDNVSKVRSMTGKDIDRIVKYDETTFKGEDRGTTAAYDYNRELTYYWNKDGGVSYKYEGLETSVALTGTHNVFVWYDEESKSWRQAAKPQTTPTEDTIILSDDEDKVEAKVTNTLVIYNGTSKFTEGSEAYKLIFGTSDSKLTYALASPCVGLMGGYVSFGFRYVNNGNSELGAFVSSQAGALGLSMPTRAVVYLESDIELSDEKVDGVWEIVTETAS